MSSSASTFVLIHGFLTKRGKNVKNWKKRWFVLRSNGILSYHRVSSAPKSDDALPKPVSVINVSDIIKICLADDAPSCDWPSNSPVSCRFSIVTEKRVFWLYADSLRECNVWISLLTEAKTQVTNTSLTPASTPASTSTSTSTSTSPNKPSKRSSVATSAPLRQTTPIESKPRPVTISSEGSHDRVQSCNSTSSKSTIDDSYADIESIQEEMQRLNSTKIVPEADLHSSDDDYDEDDDFQEVGSMPVYAQVNKILPQPTNQTSTEDGKKKRSAYSHQLTIGAGAPELPQKQDANDKKSRHAYENVHNVLMKEHADYADKLAKQTAHQKVPKKPAPSLDDDNDESSALYVNASQMKGDKSTHLAQLSSHQKPPDRVAPSAPDETLEYADLELFQQQLAQDEEFQRMQKSMSAYSSESVDYAQIVNAKRSSEYSNINDLAEQAKNSGIYENFQ